jgi:hypothetical protein
VVDEKRGAESAAAFGRRLGKSPRELGTSEGKTECPDIWELDNGDFAVIGADSTEGYAGRLPEDVVVGSGERLVVIPRATLLSAKQDIPDA